MCSRAIAVFCDFAAKRGAERMGCGVSGGELPIATKTSLVVFRDGAWLVVLLASGTRAIPLPLGVVQRRA